MSKKKLLITNISLFICVIILAVWLIYSEEFSEHSDAQLQSNLLGIDRGRGVIETKDGDIVTIGFSSKNNPAAGGYILLNCFDKTGKRKWSKDYRIEEKECWLDMTKTRDGHYLLKELSSLMIEYWKSNQDFYAIKIDLNGKNILKHTYGSMRFGHCVAVDPTVDNYILLGSDRIFGGGELWLLKTSHPVEISKVLRTQIDRKNI